MTRRHLCALARLFLFLAAVLSGIGLFLYAMEHVWFFALMVFCLVCSMAMARDDGEE